MAVGGGQALPMKARSDRIGGMDGARSTRRQVRQLPSLWPISLKWARVWAVILLLLFFARLSRTAAYSSATFDEPLHLFGSAMYWQLSRLWPAIENPLLIHALIGLPQRLLFDPALPLDHPFWGERFATLTLSSAFLWESNTTGLQMLWSGRLLVTGMALLTGALLYAWSRRATSATLPALAVLLLFTFDPNVLAHGSLSTTDMGTTLFVCLAVFIFWRYWLRPSRRLYVVAGITLGLAVSSKFSGAAVIAALAPMALYLGWRRSGRRGLLLSVAEIAGWLLLAVLVLLAVERFDLSVLADNLRAVRGAGQFGHRTYLLGQINEGGWWYYFPVVFLAKTPLPTLLLLGLALLVPLWRRQVDWQQGWPLLVAAIWIGAAMAGRINVGYRHLLPALPLLFLQVGWLLRPGYLHGRWLPRLVAGAFALLAIVSLTAHPHYLAYFNRLAGGAEGGRRIAVDSNLDWGQDVATLRDYLRANDVPLVYTALFSTTPPGVYGVPAIDLPTWPFSENQTALSSFYPSRPAAGVYAISETHLQGVYLEDPDRFAYFRGRTPDARVGKSILVYRVLPDGPRAALALSGVDLPDMPLAGYTATIDTNYLTLRRYDARSSLVWAPAEATWAAVEQGSMPGSPLLQRLYPPAARSEDTADGESRISYFRWQESPYSRLELHTPTADKVEFYAPQPAGALALPALEFAGHTAAPAQLSPGASLELLTVWRVFSPPPRPFAVYLHLLDESGMTVAQHDGWGVELDGLSFGDEVGQLHELTLPADLPPGEYTLRAGIYETAAGDRFMLGSPTSGADGLTLGTITVAAP